MEQTEYMFSFTSDIYQSVKKTADRLMPYLKDVQSVLDVGSGMGCWGKIWEDAGIRELILVDHPALPVSDLLIRKKEVFLPVDLEKDLPPVKKMDLVICTEVLEHFSEARALKVFDYLTQCSDLILFSAAIPRQGGLGHVNEQRHAYWHNRFQEKGFKYFDGFKTELLKEHDIIYYLRQNLFFYYKSNQAYRFEGEQNVTSMEFELVHNSVLEKQMRIKEALHLLMRAIKRRLSR